MAIGGVLLCYDASVHRAHCTMESELLKPLLAKLHANVIDELNARIESGEATTADISAAIKLLKDNSITVAVEDSEPIVKLTKTLPFLVAEEA